MKKYLKTLPLILYPYAYGIIFILLGLLSSLVGELPAFYAIWIALTVLYSIWVFAITLRRVIGGFRQYTPTEAAKMNLAVKCWHIPAYITHFLVGVLGVGSTLISINASGVGLIAFAVGIDLVTIFLSGLHAAGCVRRLKKEGVLSSEAALLAGIGSFIFCADVIAAIVLVQQCRKKFPPEEPDHGTGRSVRIRKALAYLSALLMALCPYAPYGLLCFSGIDPSVLSVVALIYPLLILFIAIRSAYNAFSLHSPFAAAGMNLAVKCLQIPAYLLNFLLGAFLGALLSVWGLVPVVFFFIVDVIAITLSGIYAIGCIRRLEKEGVLSSGKAILAGIGSFLFVVDVIVAIVLAGVSYAKMPKKPTSPHGSGRFRRALDYLPAVALIFYPYAYRSPLLLYVSDFSLLLMCAVLYTVLVFVIAIYEAANTFSQYAPRTAAKMILAVKVLQFPAWFLNTSVGILAAAVSEWGVFGAPFFLINGVASLCSGLYAVGGIRRLKKEGILSSGTAVLAGIGSFIVGIDMIAAIALVCVSRKKGAKTEQNETIASPQQTAVTMLPPPQAPAPDQNETQGETASPNAVNVPPQEQQTAAENPLPPPLPPIPQKPAPAQDETASPNAANAPQPKKRRKASEMPLPPPLPPAPQKPAPAQTEAGDETAREE